LTGVPHLKVIAPAADAGNSAAGDYKNIQYPHPGSDIDA
jgi:hypothetical protein